MLKVLIVDDHPMMRQGVKGVLETQDDFQVVAEAEDGSQALSLVEKHSPDLVLMDVEMPNVDGLEATHRIRANYPNTKVVALTIHDEPEFVTGLLRAGASGYVLKSSRGPSLVEAIRLASLGGIALDEKVGESILGQLSEVAPQADADELEIALTQRQTQLLQWLADGLTTRQMSQKMGLSERTIKGYVAKAMEKLGVHTRAGAVGAALRRHLINDSDREPVGGGPGRDEEHDDHKP
jgi:two-component system response regulator DegU